VINSGTQVYNVMCDCPPQQMKGTQAIKLGLKR
jgi:hypothetical protein